ncbi:MAG: hypothetical protein HZA61_05965 [Candidatus Eisenbacteria bacterium]|uniref:FlgD/Vpr Ig-like domain-containing protein n=1 Tax=Eiseniibacteriota bacterium TaxID=2212470 RepID=A0A933SBE0_UNCEI|nr:hypothetical protein [Candidatus Eisenbacteria bacterium]
MRLLPAALLTVTLAGPAFAAWSNSPIVNSTISNAAGNQYQPATVPDGAGGVIVVWQDSRYGNYDLFAQRLDSRGNALWTAGGVPVCTNAAYQSTPAVCADGSGGVVLAWRDNRGVSYDIYAQRLNASGTALWAANGLVVCNAIDPQDYPEIVADGSGGAFIGWSDFRNGAVTSYDLYAQHVLGNGTMAWTANGLSFCVAAGAQYMASMVADGSGGFCALFSDYRATPSSNDLYLQRVSSAGVQQWAANGVAVCTAAADQYAGPLETDGYGNFYTCWTDLRVSGGGTNFDVYAQAFNSAGSTMWGANGFGVSTNAAQQRYPRMAFDGVGGLFVIWTDTRSGTTNDFYGQRLSAGGQPLWAADGQLLVTADRYRDLAAMLPDGAGGFFAVWTDQRYSVSDVYAQRFNSAGTQQWTSGGVGLFTSAASVFSVAASVLGDGSLFVTTAEDRVTASTYDLFAQRVDRYGYLGETEPRITSVKDVPGDQGGRVKLSFLGSYLEDEPWYAMTSYYVYRSLPPLAAQLAARGALAVSRDPEDAARLGTVYANAYGAQDYYWELLTTLSPNYVGQYSVYAATAQDSFAGGGGRTAFMVQGRSGSKHWDSLPDSGWSVDNLAPAAPAPLTAQYAAGSTRLHWNPNTEADLAGYRLYRGSSPSFVPGPSNFVAELADTGCTDVAGAPYVYKLRAVDQHGNESPVATAMPTGTTGVEGGAPPAELALSLAGANPMRTHGTLRLAVPRSSRVRVTVFDATGRAVRTLADGEFAAGTHALEWDGADGAGRRAANGLYFARCEAAGTSRVARFVLAR